MSDLETRKKHSARFFCDLYLLLSLLLPAAVFLLCLALKEICPFGERTLLISDMNSQYVEFLADYQRVLKGEGGGFFYSWTAGMGMNYLGLIAYYLSSPFNLLLVFFPDSAILLAVSLLTTLKLACCGYTFALYLKKRFRHSSFLLPAFALLYALSGYTIGYSFNIMWLDTLMLLPLLCLMIEHELHSGNCLGLTVIFALSFIANFYTAWMSGLFSSIYFVLCLFCLWPELRQGQSQSALRVIAGHMLRFALSVSIAAGLSAFLLLPTWLVLKNNMGLAGQAFPVAEFQFSLIELPLKFFLGTFDGMKDCLPHIWCGLSGVTLASVYFLKKSIPLRERLCSLFLVVLLVLSFWLRPLDFIWHACDYPSWFPYRYAFLLVFVLLSCGAQAIMSYQITERLYVLLVLAILLLMAGCYFLFLSEVFTERVLLLNSGVLLCLALLFLRLNLRTTQGRLALLFFCLCEVFINCELIINDYADQYTERSEYEGFSLHYQANLDSVLPNSEEFFRVEKDQFRTYNDPMGVGFPGISHFSSTASVRQSQFLKRLGFDCYATWCTYDGSTAFSDALLRIRYLLSESGKPGYSEVSDGIWQNPNFFPLFFFADESFARVDMLTDNDPLQRQEALLQTLSTDGRPFFTEVPVTLIAEHGVSPSADDLIFSRDDTDKSASLDYEIVLAGDGPHTLYIPDLSLNYDVYLNGSQQIFDAWRNYSPFLVSLDQYATDDRVYVHIDLAESQEFYGPVLAYSFDLERLSLLSADLNASAPLMERTGNSHFELTFPASSEERLIISSIPFDSGWRVQAEGKDLPLRAIHEGLLGFSLPAGVMRLSIEFVPRGWREGCLISITALFSLIVMSALQCRRKNIYN